MIKQNMHVLLKKNVWYLAVIFSCLFSSAHASLVPVPDNGSLGYCIDKKVVLISLGLSGEGKTAFFKALSKKILNSIYFQHDLICEIMSENQVYELSKSYQLMVRQAVEVLSVKAPQLIILDGLCVKSPLLDVLKTMDDLVIKYVCFCGNGIAPYEEVVKTLPCKDVIKVDMTHNLDQNVHSFMCDYLDHA